MPYCPRCRFEYQAGVIRCPDCGGPLSASVPQDAQDGLDPGSEPVELCRVGDPSEAEIIRATLAEVGISSFVKTHGVITAYRASVVDGASGDYAIVYVARNRLAEAQRLLAVVRAQPPEWPQGMEPDLQSEED